MQTPEEVLLMRQLLERGWSRRRIAAELGDAAGGRCHVPEFIKPSNELTPPHVNKLRQPCNQAIGILSVPNANAAITMAMATSHTKRC